MPTQDAPEYRKISNSIPYNWKIITNPKKKKMCKSLGWLVYTLYELWVGPVQLNFLKNTNVKSLRIAS